MFSFEMTYYKYNLSGELQAASINIEILFGVLFEHCHKEKIKPKAVHNDKLTFRICV